MLLKTKLPMVWHNILSGLFSFFAIRGQSFPGKLAGVGWSTGLFFFSIFMCANPLRRVSDLDVGGALASWLLRSSPDQTVRVRALARDISLCSWARHFTLRVSLCIHVYKWVQANLMLGPYPAID